MKYVIIGNGPAAVTAAETIRRADDAGEITLLSKEDEFTYSRPLISYLRQDGQNQNALQAGGFLRAQPSGFPLRRGGGVD